MTVSTTLNKIIYTGDNSTTTWPFTFPAVASTDLQVFFTDASGNITLLNPSLYSVSFNSAISPNPTAAGGVVNYPLVGSPIATSTFLTIMRVLPLNQLTSLANQGTLYQPVIEAALDYIEMTVQQIQEEVGRSIVVAVSDPPPNPLPPAAQRANLFLAFDSTGQPVAVQPAGSGDVISAAMKPVVSASTLALARTAMGLGSMAVENLTSTGSGLRDFGGNVVALQPLVSVSTSQSPGTSNHMNRYIATGAINFNLPRGNTTFNGYGFFIEVISSSINLIPNGADSIKPNGAGTAITVFAPSTVFISNDAATNATWYVDIQSSSGVSGGVVGKTTSYSVAATDNGQTHLLGGGTGPFTVTVGAASGFPPIFNLHWYNADSSGKLLNINGITAFYIYPGQSYTLQNDQTLWTLDPPPLTRWTPPSGALRIFVNSSAADNSNDGLATGPSRAFKDLLHAYQFIKSLCDTATGTPTIICDPNLTYNVVGGLAINYQVGIGSPLQIQGNTGCVFQCNAGGFVFQARDGGATLILESDPSSAIFGTIRAAGNSAMGITASQGGVCDPPGGGLTFEAFPLGNHVAIANGGCCDFQSGGYRIADAFSSGTGIHINMEGAGAHCNYQIANGATFVGTPAIQTFLDMIDCAVFYTATQNPIFGGAPAAGCQKYALGNNAVANTSGTTLPGSVAGVASTGAIYS